MLNDNVVIEAGAIKKLPEMIHRFHGTKAFLLSGPATYQAAGEVVINILEENHIPYEKHVFSSSPVKPTEETVGSAVMHFAYDCDLIIGIGSGVINDTGKMLAKATNRPYIIVGTAPSMDGYTSATSSMERDGLKVSIDSVMPNGVIGDLDILRQAPLHMFRAGVGDMIAKYISLTEWKIASILVGEDYQEAIADQVKHAVLQVVSSAEKLMERDEEAVRQVMEGLMIAGMAMKEAGCSRPASGMEHYFSHIWDMRALAFEDAKADLHGIQCGIGTLLCLKQYERIKTLSPDFEKGCAFVKAFNLETWNQKLRSFIGPGAEAMIAGEVKEQKYEENKHAERLKRIIECWDQIQKIMEELPSYEEIYQMMDKIQAPKDPEYLGYDKEKIETTLTMTKDIRDKYIGSRLLWDLGEI